MWRGLEGEGEGEATMKLPSFLEGQAPDFTPSSIFMTKYTTCIFTA